MKKALIRLEDIGPGGAYATPDSLLKLRAIADYLAAEKVPFHVAMIPRFLNPQTGYDKSIAERTDPYIQSFHSMIAHMRACGGSIGMHGYRHQYKTAVSAEGFEFADPECANDCAPDDPVEAYVDEAAFARSYASSRMREGFATVRRSGLQVDWFETPHYTASAHQRRILEAWVGLFFEDDPERSGRQISMRDLDTPLFRGVVYVPTPLYYLDGSKPDAEVERIAEEIKQYGEQDLAAFFFHPFLDFPFLHVERAGGQIRVRYEDNSYLKRLIRAFQAQQFTFVPLLRLVPFVPSARQTDFFPGDDCVFLTGDLNGDRLSELVIWQRSTGDVYAAPVDLQHYPSRQIGPLPAEPVLSGWVQGAGWTLLTGDCNGDGRDDLIAWHPERGEWRVAYSDGKRLHAEKWIAVQGFAAGEQWTPFVADFNGDGQAELSAWNRLSGAWLVREGATVREWLHTGVFGGDCVARVGDFNGDGKADVLLWNRRQGTFEVAVSDGQQFVWARGNCAWLSEWAVGEQGELLVADFDGDGRDDLLVVDTVQGNWQVARNAGQQFQPAAVFGPWAAGAYMQPLVGVFTADRRASLCARQKWLRNGTVDFAISMLGKF